MLVLSRKKNESIVINDNIIVVVVDVRGDKVRLGVNAPSDVTVHRKEVYDAIRRQASVHALSVNTTDTLSVEMDNAEMDSEPPKTEAAAPKTKPIAKKVIKKKT